MSLPERTFTSGSCGYMLFKDGVAQGGASTLGTPTHTSAGKRKHPKTVAADRAMHRATAQRLCDEKNKVEVPEELCE